MKIGILSDTHGSSLYFNKAMEVLGECDLYLHAGDILYHGPRNDLPEGYNPKVLTESLNDMDSIIFAKGNCEADVDQMVLNHPIQGPYALVQLDEFRFVVNHGYVGAKDEIIANAKKMGADFLILGHTHVKELSFDDTLIIINPGSTSIPKDGSRSVAIVEINPDEDNDHELNIDINFYDIDTGEIIEKL